jgi:hypothetical protein
MKGTLQKALCTLQEALCAPSKRCAQQALCTLQEALCTPPGPGRCAVGETPWGLGCSHAEWGMLNKSRLTAASSGLRLASVLRLALWNASRLLESPEGIFSML